jgi:uncharacterized protein YdeI (YjbR/CyaY-like superfamily)
LRLHHASADELLVGYHKKGSGKPSITWPESVDQALCFGWIDGIRRRLSETAYSIRFTPRRSSSIWSAANIARARALSTQRLMQPAGAKAFAARRRNRSGIYSYEQRPESLPEPFRRALRQHKTAWEYFSSQTPSYRRAATWWVISAKKQETRLARLERLKDLSARRRPIPQFVRRPTGERT